MKKNFESKIVDFHSKDKKLNHDKINLKESMTVNQFTGKKITEKEDKVVDFKKAKNRHLVYNYKKKFYNKEFDSKKSIIKKIYIFLLVLIFILFILKFI